MNRLRGAIRAAAAVCFAIGFLAIGYAGYVIVDARAYQATALRQLDEERQAPAAQRPAGDGSVVGVIRIARLGLAAVVVEGDSAAILQRAVGHLSATSLPGQPGNVVLAGHRDTFFRPLARLRVGDVIAVTTEEGEFEYQVASTSVVPPGAVQVLAPTAQPTLTLITCYPFGYLGAAPNRFVARALETRRPGEEKAR